MVISQVWLDARPSNFDGRLSVTPRFYPCKVTAQVRNKNFTLYNMLNSHLSHKRTWQPFSQRRDAHDDTKNIWDMSNGFWDKFMERTEISAFFLTFFALAGVKILHLHENWIWRCTIPDDGEQNGARMKSIAPTVSDLHRQEKKSSSSYSSWMNVQIVFTFFKVRISRKPR